MSTVVTALGLVDFCKSKLGTPYVYGMKGDELTNSKLNALSKSYPSMFTSTYKTKAKKFIGKKCTDCSGLISWYTGKVLSSSGLYASAKERHPISSISSAPKGAILWKSGHVGVYIGDGYCIEAKGIDYGVVKSKVSNTKFTHWMLMNYIDYGTGTSNNVSHDNWIKDLQQAINRSDRTANLVEDGIPGPKTLEACPLLKKGSKGLVVKVLQERYKVLGYYRWTSTGKFGAGTCSATKKFQSDKCLSVDAKVGQKTWKELLDLY